MHATESNVYVRAMAFQTSKKHVNEGNEGKKQPSDITKKKKKNNSVKLPRVHIHNKHAAATQTKYILV